MNDTSSLTPIYQAAESPADLAKERLHDISDEYLVDITYFPNKDNTNLFQIQLKKYNEEEYVSSDWMDLSDLEPYQQWALVEEVVQSTLRLLPDMPWEYCGVDGCQTISVGPCDIHK